MDLGTDVGYKVHKQGAENSPNHRLLRQPEMRRRSAYVRRAARLRGSGDGRVDEDLYGRQLCVIGHAALRSLARSTILLIGPTRRCRPLVTFISFFGGNSGHARSPPIQIS